MKIKNPFPKHRLHDPKRRAELAVYRELEASTAPGVALYEPTFGPYTRGLDFAVLVEGQGGGRYGIEVKGGQHRVTGATWWLATPSGPEEVDCPALQAWDGAMAFRDRIARKKGRGPFVVPVVIFPDMERDTSVVAMLADSAVYAIFGVADLTGQLSQLTHVQHPPTTADIARETALVMGAALEPEPEATGPYAQGLDDRQVIIHNVENLHIHTQAAP